MQYLNLSKIFFKYKNTHTFLYNQLQTAYFKIVLFCNNESLKLSFELLSFNIVSNAYHRSLFMLTHV